MLTMTPERARELLESPSYWPITSRITEAERLWLLGQLEHAPEDRTIQDVLRDVIASSALDRAA